MKTTKVLALLFVFAVCDAGRRYKKKKQENLPQKGLSQVELLLNGLSDANNKFGFDVYKILKSTASIDDNIFFSPGCLSTALSMTLLGTAGKTSQELGKALNWKEEQYPIFHTVMRSFLASVQKMNDDAKNKFEIANRIWMQKDFPVREEFLNNTQHYYFAPVKFINFAESEKATKAINEWVKKKTRNKITEIIPDGVIDETTRFALTNALFFKGAWEIEFNKTLTTRRDFNLPSKEGEERKTKKVHMMKTRGKFGFARCKQMSMVELLYKGGNFSMAVFLPDKNIETVEKHLTVEFFKGCLNRKKSKDVIISLPKFKVRGNYKMKEVVQNLGVKRLFNAGKADFSGLADPPRSANLYVDEIFHQSFIKVNEVGSEAGSSTAVIVKERSMPRTMAFYVDKPFLFTIQEKSTGAIFFIGKIADP